MLKEQIATKAIRCLLYLVNRIDCNNLEVYLFYKEVCYGYLEATNKKFVYGLTSYSFIKDNMKQVVVQPKYNKESKYGTSR